MFPWLIYGCCVQNKDILFNLILKGIVQSQINRLYRICNNTSDCDNAALFVEFCLGPLNTEAMPQGSLEQ